MFRRLADRILASSCCLSPLWCVAAHTTFTVTPAAIAVVALVPAPRAQAAIEARFANPTSHRRREWGLATVPFPQGTWKPGDHFRPEGLEGELTPFGATWGDGSVRYAQLAVRLDLLPQQEQIVRVVRGAPQNTPFRLSPWVTHSLGRLQWAVIAGANQGVRYAPLVPQRFVHDSDVRKTIHCTARIPETDLIYDLWLTVFSDQDHVPFEMRVTSSQVGSPRWKQEIDALVLAVDGCWPAFRGGISRDVQTLQILPMRAAMQLLGPTHLWDGQAQEWWGDLLFAFPEVPIGDASLRGDTLMATLDTPLYGCATNWKASGALGPFGHIPEHPTWVTDPRQTTSLERGRFDSWYRAPGRPWDDLPRGLLPQASSSGDQYDFGVVKMLHVFHTGLPALVEEARHAAGEEAHRPNHHREAGGRVVRAAAHPDWVTWSGRTHFSRSVSSDRLGKPHPEPWPESQGWGSRDNQHWSSLTLASAYLLTRSYSLEMDIDAEVEAYLAGHTLPSTHPGWPTNGIDSSRGVGRTLLTFSWHYLLTGRADLRTHIAERIRQCIAQQWTGRNVAGPVRPITHSGPDPRVIGGYDFWRPWEDSLAILGLEAAYRVTGRQEARDLAVIGAKTLFTYGWRAVGNDAEIATGLRWRADGTPLTAVELSDPTQAVWSAGTGFELWALPACKLARQWARDTNDADLFLRTEYVLGSLARSRAVPSHRRWDSYYEWDAIP